MSDAGEACACEADNASRAVTVLNICVVHNKCKHVTLRVRHDVSLAAPDLLSEVEVTGSASFSRFETLNVNIGGHRRIIATTKLTRDVDQRFVERIEDAAFDEPVEIIPDSRVRQKTPRL